MAQSLSKIYVHIVFHTKYSQPLIRPEIEPELFAYMGRVIKTNDSIPIKINGVENHVHILAILSKNVALSKFLEEIKRNSSRWIKTKGEEYKDFKWQGGYGAFSVNERRVEHVKRYIENQKEHHKRVSFKEEYIKLLDEHGVEYDERYLWT